MRNPEVHFFWAELGTGSAIGAHDQLCLNALPFIGIEPTNNWPQAIGASHWETNAYLISWANPLTFLPRAAEKVIRGSNWCLKFLTFQLSNYRGFEIVKYAFAEKPVNCLRFSHII